MKILVVEDDRIVAQTLQILFSGYNYAVDIAVDGEAGLQMAEAFDYDLILLDVILPKLDGISVCHRLRTEGFRSPILLLTGQGEGRQKAIALNAGADDYVVKPFDTEELVARVQALLRRNSADRQPTLTWGNLSIDPSSRKVAYGTHLMAVTPKEYAILELFLRHPQRILSAAVMLDHVWNSVEPPGEEAVRVHIKELRQKLKAVGAPKDFIKTVHRVGYQLNPRYSNFLAVQVEQQPTAPQIAELAVVNQELRLALEELRMAKEELRRQNEYLETTRQTLELERQHYRDLFEFAPDAYLVTDIGGIIQDANSAAAKLLHVDPQYLIDKPLYAFIAEFSRHEFRLQLAQLNFAENWEVSLSPKQGDPVPVLVAVTHIKDLHNEIVGLRWLLRDIRSRKEMEQQLRVAREELEIRVAERTAELRQREEFLSSIYDGADQAVFVINVTGTGNLHYVAFNYKAEQYGGVSQQDIQGKTPEEAFGTVIGAAFRQNYEQCLQAKKSTSYEEHLVFEDRNIWTLTTLSPLRNEQGQIYRIVGTAVDITDRKQAEAALRESERRYHQILDSIADIVFVKQSDSRLIWGNRAFREYYGMTLEDLQGIVDAPFNEPDYTRQYVHDDEYVFKAGQALTIAEEPITRHDGVVQIFNTIKAPIFNEAGQVVMLVGVCRDITDRKLAEQKIRQQAALLDIASDAISVRDLNHCILYWNQGAERLYGWQTAEAIGQKANALLQDYDASMQEIMQTLLAQGEWRGEMVNITKTGRQVIVETRWTLVRNRHKAEQPQFILTVDTDITEKKQLEAQFYRAQRLESLGTLASGIAHDLNNVLTPILATAQLLQLQQTNSNQRSQGMLKILEDSAKRGADLIKQILTFTRGTGGERRPVQVVSLLQELIQVIQQTFPKSISIRQNIPDPASCLVCADATHLHQVLMNLCVNARDAMPNGGVLSLTVEQCFVDQAFAQANLDAQVGNYVVVTVADTGMGIPPEIRDRIFDPFFTTKAQGQGTGLGLATVLGIVKNYDGFVQVVTDVGQGTQIKVFLPAIEEILTCSSQPQAQLAGSGELILLVDDDVAVQCSTQSLLESHHFTVLSSQDGREAIALYKQHQAEIRVVILDIMMPNMSGILLIQKLKEMNPAVQIIAISGLPTNRESALAAGATTFLSKPYSLNDLLEKIKGLLSSK